MKRLWRKRRRRVARCGAIQRRTMKAFGLRKLPVYGAIVWKPEFIATIKERVRQVLAEGADVVIYFKRYEGDDFEDWDEEVKQILDALQDMNPRDRRLDDRLHFIYLAPKETNQ